MVEPRSQPDSLVPEPNNDNDNEKKEEKRRGRRKFLRETESSLLERKRDNTFLGVDGKKNLKMEMATI